MGENWRTWKKPTQTWGECMNSTPSVAWPGIKNLFSHQIIMKRHWKKQHYLRPCCTNDIVSNLFLGNSHLRLYLNMPMGTWDYEFVMGQNSSGNTSYQREEQEAHQCWFTQKECELWKRNTTHEIRVFASWDIFVACSDGICKVQFSK